MEENIKEEQVNKLSVKYIFKDKKRRLKFITRVSMFTALAFVFYQWLKFPLVMLFPSFLEINFSTLFILIGAFSTGPVGGAIICILRFIFKLATTTTGCAGEICDLILALAVTVPSSLYYSHHHDKKGGYIALIIAFLIWVIVSIPINLFIALPLYKVLAGIGKEEIISAMSMISGVGNDNYLVLYSFACVLPFNAIIAFINCGLSMIVYKRLSVLLKKLGI